MSNTYMVVLCAMCTVSAVALSVISERSDDAFASAAYFAWSVTMYAAAMFLFIFGFVS